MSINKGDTDNLKFLLYNDKIPSCEVEEYESIRSSIIKIYDGIGIDVEELDMVFLCFQEKSKSIDFYYVLNSDPGDLEDAVKEINDNDKPIKLKLSGKIDNDLKIKILEKCLKGET